MIKNLARWVRAVRQGSCWMIAALAGMWLAPASAQEVEDLLTPRMTPQAIQAAFPGAETVGPAEGRPARRLAVNVRGARFPGL